MPESMAIVKADPNGGSVALAPMNLLLITSTGGALYTGSAAFVSAAFIEDKTHWINTPRTLIVAGLGNAAGGLFFVLFIQHCGLNVGGTAQPAIKTAEEKTKAEFIKTPNQSSVGSFGRSSCNAVSVADPLRME